MKAASKKDQAKNKGDLERRSRDGLHGEKEVCVLPEEVVRGWDREKVEEQ